MATVDRKFNLRTFAVLMITFSGLGLPVTGLANHLYGFAPPSVERHAWMSAHNVLALLFTVFAVWHVILNRRALWNHLQGLTARLPRAHREAVVAGAVVAVALLVFVGHAFHAGGAR